MNIVQRKVRESDDYFSLTLSYSSISASLLHCLCVLIPPSLCPLIRPSLLHSLITHLFARCINQSTSQSVCLCVSVSLFLANHPQKQMKAEFTQQHFPPPLLPVFLLLVLVLFLLCLLPNLLLPVVFHLPLPFASFPLYLPFIVPSGLFNPYSSFAPFFSCLLQYLFPPPSFFSSSFPFPSLFSLSLSFSSVSFIHLFLFLLLFLLLLFHLLFLLLLVFFFLFLLFLLLFLVFLLLVFLVSLSPCVSPFCSIVSFGFDRYPSHRPSALQQ